MAPVGWAWVGLTLRSPTHSVFEGLEHYGWRQDFWQHLRLGSSRKIEQIERHRAPLPFCELGGDTRIGVGPVAFEKSNVAIAEGLSDFVGAEYQLLVRLARRAPTGGEVHVDGTIFSTKLRDALKAPRLPHEVSCTGGAWPAHTQSQDRQHEPGRESEAYSSFARAGHGVAPIEPGSHCNYGKAEERGKQPVLARLTGEHPHQIGHGRIERKSHRLFEGFHP